MRAVCKRGRIACEKPEQACEARAVRVQDTLAVIAYDVCVSCGKCVAACPTGALADARERAVSRARRGQQLSSG